MAWLQSLDANLLRFVNLHLQHPILDEVMRFLSGGAPFGPLLVLAGLLVVWKGGTRARVLALLAAVILLAGDNFVVAMLKKAVGRPRPFMELADLRVLVGKGGSGSMPSSHAASWFAATLLVSVFYRRSWRFMLPLACGVGFSRIYLGVHYPSDVLAGAIIGAGYAVAGLFALDALWRWAGPEWFPVWWAKWPSLLNPDAPSPVTAAVPAPEAALERHWLRLGYAVIVVALISRLVFIAGDSVELSEDEAYQWVWSKHLALSYYSKPPMIAYAQRLGTWLWGDTAFGVRFLSPLIGATVGWLLLRFLARVADAETGFCLVLILLTTPLLAVGSTLLTIDPLLVLFWTLTVILGWRAAQPDSTAWHWLGVGLAMGLAFLSKYSACYLIACWAIFFALSPPARIHLRRPGPYLALVVNLLCTLPVVIWNAQHGWITAQHVAERSGFGQEWRPTLRFFLDFLFAEGALLNPFFFFAAIWAMAAFWRGQRDPEGQTGRPADTARRTLMLYLFCMGPTVFLAHALYTFHARVLPNWIAPAIAPMFALMVLFWVERWRQGQRSVRGWLTAGVIFGLVSIVLVQQPKVIGKIVGRDLPPDKDPLRRVRAWSETTHVVEEARERLAREGKPVFFIADHYGMTGLLTFYLPEAKAGVRGTPLVYCLTRDKPENQFYFWPEYRYRSHRRGQNAIYVVEPEVPRYSMKTWFKSLRGGTGEVADEGPVAPTREEAPAELIRAFASVKDLGVQPVYFRGRVYRWIQLFECRDLR
jgi:membrane-associated phospholipid phosphatase